MGLGKSVGLPTMEHHMARWSVCTSKADSIGWMTTYIYYNHTTATEVHQKPTLLAMLDIDVRFFHEEFAIVSGITVPQSYKHMFPLHNSALSG